MIIVLDNAESILDPGRPSARKIYAIVDELTRFSNICLCITSRISIIPPDCKIINVPTLSTEATRDAFYQIYGHKERSNSVNDILGQLDNHPLSITLLATVARHNQWDTRRLVVEWDKQRTGVLRGRHPQSLATAIGLSLASPMFRRLGSDARLLLEVVAFLPQGVNEKNANWLFPTISNVQKMLDRFCILSLAHRNNGFIMMLAPLRDHLRPKDPSSSPLLRITMKNYFMRLSGEICPGTPEFEEGRWITTEDVNVEHLLDVFTTIGGNAESIWGACEDFMAQLYWHKPRLVTLGPKIEALPDNHPSKAPCLMHLSRLLDKVGNYVECKRLRRHALKLWREWGDDFMVATVLSNLSDTNRRMGLREEGMRQAEEASEIFERIGDVVQQAVSLMSLAWLLGEDGQLDAAKEAGSHAIDLLPENGEEILVCQAHRVLGEIHRYKGKTRKAIRHFEMVLEIASSLNMVSELFWGNYALAEVFREQDKFEDAQIHLEHARSHAVTTYLLARTMGQQAWVWYKQRRLEDAKSEALRAVGAFEKLGAADDAEATRQLLRDIEARRPGRS